MQKLSKTTGNRAVDEDLRRLYAQTEALQSSVTALQKQAPATTSTTAGKPGPQGPPGPPGPSGGGLLYVDGSIPSGNTIANTAAETAFASQYTMQQPNWAVGSVVRITMNGVYSIIAGAQTLRGRVYLGSNVIIDTAVGFTITGPQVGGHGWTCRGEFVVNAVGSSGAIVSGGYWMFDYDAISSAINVTGGTLTFSIDTTASQLLKSTVQWTTADPGNTITLNQMIVELIQ